MKCSSPINITNKPSGKCNLKCKFSFKYLESTSIITNKGNHLSFSYEHFNPAPVIYNSKYYQVDEIKIVSPSLHTYDGTTADAELLIYHTGDYGKLIVSVPIMKSSMFSSSASDLEKIIANTYKNAKKINAQYVSQTSINLNNYVPNKQYYSYNGSSPLPNSPCNEKYSIIVFNKNDGAYMTMSSEHISLLNLLL